MVGAVPRNHGANVTCLVAMGSTGMLAPCVFEGAVDSALFVTWVQQWLVPTLPCGTTVVMDNLSVHRVAAVRAVLARAGCALIYLPAYSPDFNPIELAFSKLKTHLRTIAARTYDHVLDAIGTGLTSITATDGATLMLGTHAQGTLGTPIRLGSNELDYGALRLFSVYSGRNQCAALLTLCKCGASKVRVIQRYLNHSALEFEQLRLLGRK